jgi:hypothetical protein
MIAVPLQDKARRQAVDGLRAAGKGARDKPADFAGHKKLGKERVDQSAQEFQPGNEAEAFPQSPYFDALKWRTS